MRVHAATWCRESFRRRAIFHAWQSGSSQEVVWFPRLPTRKGERVSDHEHRLHRLQPCPCSCHEQPLEWLARAYLGKDSSFCYTPPYVAPRVSSIIRHWLSRSSLESKMGTSRGRKADRVSMIETNGKVHRNFSYYFAGANLATMNDEVSIKIDVKPKFTFP